MTPYLVLDIETVGHITPQMKELLIDKLKVGNVKDPEKIRRAIAEKTEALEEKAALSPLTGEVAVVGLGWEHAEGDTTIQTITAEKGEVELLQALDSALATINPQRVVTFNGRKFDFPFIAARTAILGLDLPMKWPLGRTYEHIDLHELWDLGSLDQWQVAMGYKRKSIPGSEIPAMVLEGRWQEVCSHCEEDVRFTLELYRRTLKCVDLNVKR